MNGSRQLMQALTGHRFYRYRGCAPAPDAEFEGQSLGDPGLSVDAWAAEADPADQEAAAAACGRCPLLEACRAEALAESGELPVRVPEQVRQVAGGMLPARIQQEVRRRRNAEYAYRVLTEHRFYQYRGCAPAEVAEFRGQSLGDPGLSVDAWSPPPEDGGEPQDARLARERAALAVCATCPVLDACRDYALSETGEGQLAEPIGILGGLLSLERHRMLVERRRLALAAATAGGVDLSDARTAQKQAVLAALAAHAGEEKVAAAAGMDVRTANWHRSGLCGLLGLDRRTATRMQLLDAARTAGVLPAGAVPVPDGRVPVIAAPNGDGSRQRQLVLRRVGVQLEVWPPAMLRRLHQPHPPARARRPAARRRGPRTTGPGPGRAGAVPGRGGPRLRLLPPPSPAQLALTPITPATAAPVLEPAA